jgi:hypothetical protein
MNTGITDALTVQPADEPAPASLVKPEAAPEAPAVEPKPARWKELLVTVLLSALVGAAVAGGAIVGVEAALGRFTRGDNGQGQGGNLEISQDGDLLTQRGKVTVPAGGTVQVFYPKAYANPPALTWKTEGGDYFRVGKQTPTGFEVQSAIAKDWVFQWEATGVADRGGRKDKDEKR